jgi:hypothetical protein
VSNATQPTGIDRREAIKTALRLSGAAYVAPLVLGSVTPVAARQGSPSACTGSVCPTLADCTPPSGGPLGGNGFECTCFTLATGGGFCASDFVCGDFDECQGDLSCQGAGEVCVINTCCPGETPHRCIPITSQCGVVTQSGSTQRQQPSLRGRGPRASGRTH